MWELVRKPRITDLNRSLIPMQTLPHLYSDPIKEFQREGGVVFEVGPVLCIPVSIEDPDCNNCILDTLVCLGFQVLG